MQDLIVSYFSGFPREWAVFFLSMVPVTELRATIPLAITRFGMSPALAYVYAVAGNTLMGAIVVIVVKPLTRLVIEKSSLLRRLWQRYINRIRIKNEKKFEKWGALALILFIAIPLPVTGVFTGAVAASIFQVPFKKSVFLLFIGCAIAGIIVTGITLGAAKVF